jgi:hypothetical protein
MVPSVCTTAHSILNSIETKAAENNKLDAKQYPAIQRNLTKNTIYSGTRSKTQGYLLKGLIKQVLLVAACCSIVVAHLLQGWTFFKIVFKKKYGQDKTATLVSLVHRNFDKRLQIITDI